jgi:hypothetical protein
MSSMAKEAMSEASISLSTSIRRWDAKRRIAW